MKLTHYARSSDIIIPKSTHQSVGADYKPRGLWVSVDGQHDWRAWCESENYSGLGSHTHEVKLRRGAKILRLRSAKALDAFTDLYSLGLYPKQGKKFGGINWKAVAEQHQGIIIAPYIWSRRLDLMWYYGWDCASGCIWDADAIKSITYTGLLPHHEKDEARSAAKIFAGVEPATMLTKNT